MKYRNTLQITAELLDITKDSGMNGIGTTNLIQKNNRYQSTKVKQTQNETQAIKTKKLPRG